MKIFFLITVFAISEISAINSGRNTTSRIVGGNDAFVDEWPFMAAITARTSTSQFFCGGCLINNQWILTSAQCVFNVVQFTVNLGSNTLKGPDPNRMTLTTSESVIHPDFDPITFLNDVGLIKLRIPITFTDYIKPIKKLMNSGIVTYFPAFTAGWGQISDGQAGETNTLQTVHLMTLGHHECSNTYGDYITETHICGLGQYNEGTCIGDSGNPFVMKEFTGNGWMHAGIASFMSANGCESTDPSVFTRTDYFFNWVQNITGKL